MASVFSKIIAGELPSYKIYETESTIAILALHQVKLGHTLVIPKTEVDFWYDLDDTEYAELMQVAKKIAPAIQAATECTRVGTAVVGFEVPHFHLHLIPMWGPEDLNFSRAQILDGETMTKIQVDIGSYLKGK